MSSQRRDGDERARLQELSARLRQAACDAWARQSVMAASLDEARAEIDHLLMLGDIDEREGRRVVMRAQMMLDAWRGMSGGSAAGAR